MLRFCTRLFIALCAGYLLVSAIISAHAETIAFPTNNPAYTFTLPEGWKCKEKGTTTTCKETEDSAFLIQFFQGVDKAITDGPSAKAFLSKIILKMGAEIKLEPLEIGKIYDYKNGHKINFTGVLAQGKTQSLELYVNPLTFAPEGKFFLMEFVGTVAAKTANDKVEHDVLESIAAIPPLVGEWRGPDITGATVSMVFGADGKYKMVDADSVIVDSTKDAKVTWRLDSTKDPMQLDILASAGDKQKVVMPMIVRFLSGNKMQVGMPPDLETRPGAFSPSDSATQVTLSKQ